MYEGDPPLVLGATGPAGTPAEGVGPTTPVAGVIGMNGAGAENTRAPASSGPRSSSAASSVGRGRW